MDNSMSSLFLKKWINNPNTISQEEYDSFLNTIWENRIHRGRVIAFLAALSAKPINLTDVIAFVKFIATVSPRKRMICSDRAINIVGTGGGLSTFNISTASAFVACSAGAMVLKSGSHGYTSKCGSLDVLKALGLNVRLNEDSMEKMVEEIGIGFVNPEMYSPFLKRLAMSIFPLDIKEIGQFINTIGPLLCPVDVHGQITGVNSPKACEILCSAMQILEMTNSIVSWSEIGIDEVSAIGKSHLFHIGKKTTRQIVDASYHGFYLFDEKHLQGGSPEYNAEMIQSIFQGKLTNEALDVVLINSALILVLAGTVADIDEGIRASRDAIIGGRVLRKLRLSIEFANDHAV